jgi:hypothetical protein
MRLLAITLPVALICSSIASATPSVTLTLESTKNGQTVAPSTIVDWTIKAAVSTGDNAGLALVSADLVQNASNPAAFDLPKGDPASIDVTMQNFDRPAGIANPGEDGAATGYIGSQRGDDGHKNLIQIGGGQNTFGAALPSGTGVGESATVIAGAGQGAEPQVVLSGSFAAPATAGTYTFHLENGLANVLNQIDPPPVPPQYWTVTAATIDVASASITITVGPGYTRGDVNCDGQINGYDIDPFVLALTDPSGYEVQFQNCDIASADVNCDGQVNGYDIDPFVLCLTSGCPECAK